MRAGRPWLKTPRAQKHSGAVSAGVTKGADVAGGRCGRTGYGYTGGIAGAWRAKGAPGARGAGGAKGAGGVEGADGGMHRRRTWHGDTERSVGPQALRASGAL